MKLAISNLAFPKGADLSTVCKNLKSLGVDGLEIAPSHVGNGIDLSQIASIRLFNSIVANYGMKVSGLQSLFYGHPEMQLFDRTTWPLMSSHLKTQINLAVELGTQILVFGSPRNRIKGELTQQDANLMAAEFFQLIHLDLISSGVTLAIEPNATKYGADWLTTYRDCVDFSTFCNITFIQAQIDTGSMILSGEDSIAGVRSNSPAHVHISMPDLAPPSETTDFSKLSSVLDEIGYKKWVVLEMLSSEEFGMGSLSSVEWLVRNFGRR